MGYGGDRSCADFSRNLGLISAEQQRLLNRANIAVCGVGGMGGVAAEALARLGVGRLTIADSDVYSASDMNRQLHCTQEVIGQAKVDVIARKLKAINPQLVVETAGAITSTNVTRIVSSSDIVINGMDCMRSSILLEREARRWEKSIVDAWLTPYASVFVMTPTAPHWEEFLDLPTRGKPLDEISDADIAECLRCEIAYTFSQFEPYTIVTERLVEDVLAARLPRPSLLPVVWLSGTLIANEVMKLITRQGRLATHWGVFYNQYTHEVRYMTEGRRHELACCS